MRTVATSDLTQDSKASSLPNHKQIALRDDLPVTHDLAALFIHVIGLAAVRMGFLHREVLQLTAAFIDPSEVAAQPMNAVGANTEHHTCYSKNCLHPSTVVENYTLL